MSMDRATRARLKRAAMLGNKPARFALATDAESRRLKRERKRLREVLEVIAAMPAQPDGGGSKWNHQQVALTALKPLKPKRGSR